MQQLALELPLPPVGIGATWAIERPVEQTGVVFKSRTSYELVELSGDVAKVRSEIWMTGPDQTVREGAASAELTELGGSGHGEFSVDLRALAVTGVVSSSYHGALRSDGQRTELGMTLTVEMTRAEPP